MTVEKRRLWFKKELPKEEIKETTDRFLKLMKIEEYRSRMPENYLGTTTASCFGRALAITPNVLLMDEPLSNLDAKLRVEMRTLLKKFKIPLVLQRYITHDQEEAMAVSDRIAVMNLVIFNRLGTPKFCIKDQPIYL